MKKFIALLLTLVMVLSLAACSVEKTEPTTTQATTAATEKPADDAAPTEAAEPAAASEISVWLYPVGGWGDETQ